MKVLFITGFRPIVVDRNKSRELYAEALGINFKEEEGGYLHTSDLEGSNHFALWPLSQAAESCFGTEKWLEGLPAPKSWLEFDVDDIEAATMEMEEKGTNFSKGTRKSHGGRRFHDFLIRMAI